MCGEDKAWVEDEDGDYVAVEKPNSCTWVWVAGGVIAAVGLALIVLVS